MSILCVLRPLKRRPVDDLHAVLVWPHCCLATSAVLVRACQDLCPAVLTTLPEVAPARPAPVLAALPIVRVAWLIPACPATCGPHLMALGMTCPCFKAALVALAAAREAADLAAARASRLQRRRPWQEGDDRLGVSATWKKEQILAFSASIARSPNRLRRPPSSPPVASETTCRVPLVEPGSASLPILSARQCQSDWRGSRQWC
jgi:hypothetical protein